MKKYEIKRHYKAVLSGLRCWGEVFRDVGDIDWAVGNSPAARQKGSSSLKKSPHTTSLAMVRGLSHPVQLGMSKKQETSAVRLGERKGRRPFSIRTGRHRATWDPQTGAQVFNFSHHFSGTGASVVLSFKRVSLKQQCHSLISHFCNKRVMSFSISSSSTARQN